MLVTFPCILLLLDFWPLERWRQNSKWSLVIEKAPFFLLVVPACIVIYSAEKLSGQLTVLHLPVSLRLETALMGYARYLGKLFWPADLSVLYPYPSSWPVSQLICAATLIFGITLLAVSMHQRRPYLLVGWLWYLGTLVPVIGLIHIGVQSMANNYTYLPIIGMLLFLIWGIDDLTKRWRHRSAVIVTVVALAIVVCMIRTRAEIVYWKNGETLWNRAVAVTKDNFMAHYLLGNILAAANPDQAFAEIQKSVAIYPDNADAQRDLAFLLQNAGRYPDAEVHFERAIQLEPQNGWAYHGFGITLLKMGRPSDAVPNLLKAIELDPRNAPDKDDLNSVLFPSGHEADSISNFLATAQSDSAGFDHFLDAMESDTNHVVLINNLAWAFATNPDSKVRNGKYAVRLATRACEMTGFKINHCVGTLAAAYAEDARFDDAISTAQLACSLTSAAGQQELLKKYQSLLELFRSHQPYHEFIKASSP